MDGSTPGLPVPHDLPKFAQVHVHCIGDTIQPYHPLTLSSPSALNLSQHYRLFPMSQFFASDDQNTGASHSVSVLLMSIQGWFPWILTGLISLLSNGLSGVFSRSQFESINSSSFCLVYGPVLTPICDQWENHSLDYMDFCQQSNVSAFQYIV